MNTQNNHDLEELVQHLRKEYHLPDTSITIRERNPHKRIEQNHACVNRVVIKGNRMWEIDIVGGPIDIYCTHEFLHIVLEESGRFFEPSKSNAVHQEYLFGLKYCIDDYLIETEIKKRFPNRSKAAYANQRLNVVSYMRFPNDPIDAFMDLLGIRAICSYVYPSLRRKDTACFLGKYIKSNHIEDAVACFKKRTFSNTDASTYRELITQVHEYLTGSSITIYPDCSVRLGHVDQLDATLFEIKSIGKALGNL